jgi:hypothetical protein
MAGCPCRSGERISTATRVQLAIEGQPSSSRSASPRFSVPLVSSRLVSSRLVSSRLVSQRPGFCSALIDSPPAVPPSFSFSSQSAVFSFATVTGLPAARFVA